MFVNSFLSLQFDGFNKKKTGNLPLFFFSECQLFMLEFRFITDNGIILFSENGTLKFYP